MTCPQAQPKMSAISSAPLMSEKATRHSWNIKEMPSASARVLFERVFSPKQYERISHGLVPKQMEDKWFVYLEGDWLYIHRSWTGCCVFQVRLEPCKNGYRVAEAWVNDDPEQQVDRRHRGVYFLEQIIDYLTRRLDPLERYRGSLLGLAAGDALGAPLEGTPPGKYVPLGLDDMVGGGPFDLEVGEWTDDTSMALCLAESLLERRGFDPVDQLERYCRWAREGHLSSTGGCFDIGGTVLTALLRFEQTNQPYCGSSDPMTAGNGSIMRLAPVPLFYTRKPQEAIEKAGESSRTTHGAATAVDACRYLGALLVGAVNGASKEELLSERYSPVPGYWKQHPLVKEIDEIATGSFKRRRPPEIRGTGYVVESLEAALWALHSSSSFREGCLLAVNLGDDADTTGAVYGQLAGALYGEQAISESWRFKLAHRELIESFAERLFRQSATL